jgi:hypothetical protein
MSCSTANGAGSRDIVASGIIIVQGMPYGEQDRTNEREGKRKNFHRRGVFICTVYDPSLQSFKQGEYRHYRKILLHGIFPVDQIAYTTMMARVTTTITAIQRPGWLMVKSARLLVTRG